MYSPVVEFLTPESSTRFRGKKKAEYPKEELDEISVKNLINGTDWASNDIMLLTPVLLSVILRDKDKYDPFDINPAVIAMDEFDHLFTNSGTEKTMLEILRKFAGREGNLRVQNLQRQFLLAGATVPKKIYDRDTMETLNRWFVDL